MKASLSQPALSGNTLQLLLATGAFAICFAVFGSVSAIMPTFKETLKLTPFQVSMAIALPVLLGSLGRIPLGMLTDRYGGRIVFAIVMACAVVPAFLIGLVSNYWQLLVCGFFIGIALAVFSVGVGFVSGWYPPERQGAALGIYGAGNVGQSLAAFGSPMLAGALGFKWGFWVFGILLLVWLAVFLLTAQNAPRRAPAKSLADIARPLRDPMSWLLSLYYFLTFGGFVAMGSYLPTFLTDMFHLSKQDAGFRTAGFVLLATLMRPVGGALAVGPSAVGWLASLPQFRQTSGKQFGARIDDHAGQRVQSTGASALIGLIVMLSGLPKSLLFVGSSIAILLAA